MERLLFTVTVLKTGYPSIDDVVYPMLPIEPDYPIPPSYPGTTYPSYPIPSPPTKKRRKFYEDEPDRKDFEKQENKGYNVFIKDRYMFAGKKQKKEKLIRINKNPLSRNDALTLMGLALDNSAAQTGNIKPAGKIAREPSIMLSGNWTAIEHKFIQKNNNTFVERRGNAIDTAGEIEGISALGWFKRQPRNIKRIKTKAVRSDIDFNKLLGRETKNINIDKVYSKMIKEVFS
jgi:hypothetical protein